MSTSNHADPGQNAMCHPLIQLRHKRLLSFIQSKWNMTYIPVVCIASMQLRLQLWAWSLLHLQKSQSRNASHLNKQNFEGTMNVMTCEVHPTVIQYDPAVIPGGNLVNARARMGSTMWDRLVC